MIQNCILSLLLNSLIMTLLLFYYLCKDILDGLILETICHHPFSKAGVGKPDRRVLQILDIWVKLILVTTSFFNHIYYEMFAE